MDSLDTPEFSLLLACARPQADAATVSRQRELLAQIEPQAFVALVDRHRIAPIVCHHLLKQHEECLADDLCRELQSRQREAVFSRLAMTRELLKLDELLSASGIDYVTLKGLPLSHHYFGDASLRYSHDIDFLVADDAVDDAFSVLLAAGYVPQDGFEKLTPGQRKHFMTLFHHCSFLSPQGGIWIEMHWRPVFFPGMLADVSVRNPVAAAVTTELAGRKIPLLPKESMLLYLCVHGTVHLWFRLKWLFDLPSLLEQESWDWEKVFVLAKKNQCERHLALGLQMASEFCRWQAPDRVARWLQQYDVAVDIRDVREALQLPDIFFEQIPPLPIYWRQRCYLSRFQAVGERFFIVRTMMTSVNDWLLLPLPDSLFWLYFPLRPFLWLWRRLFPRQGEP